MSEQLALQPRNEQTAISPMEIIQQALKSGASPEVVRELVALQQSMERFNWEREERQAKIDFDTALNVCQSQIGRIAPNRERERGIGWADYAQLDKVVRPIYIDAGFSIGFSEVESADRERLRMRATVSRGGISREYFADISRKPANSGMNALDADASAASRVKRYLMLDIFNIAVGIDKDEKKPFDGKIMDERRTTELLEFIKAAPDRAKLQKQYLDALAEAEKIGDTKAIRDIIAAKDKRLKEL